jgi:diaminopimelate epimerase
MHIRFTKMQGAGNDFVVLDETQQRLNLSAAQYRWLADRHFGVGADQILSVRPSPGAGLDFEYIIHNADGGEVEHCGNGARCFVRFVHDQGLSTRNPLRVKVQKGTIELAMRPDGLVRVNMGAPVWAPEQVPFDTDGLTPHTQGNLARWSLDVPGGAQVWGSVVSMGNPHVVIAVDDVATAPVAEVGAWLECHPRFAQRVNVGFLQVVSPQEARLRVFERGAGETLACGTGACAAVVAGIRWGVLSGPVKVHTHGGELHIDWADSAGHNADVIMSGPATRVFEGEIELPDVL